MIVRSSWLFGAGGPCFPATILRLAAECDELKVVDDQVGCPTFTAHLADALVELGGRAARPHGIVHVAGGGSCSWFEFAQEIFRLAGLRPDLSAVTSEEYAAKARRPKYSVLDNLAFRRAGFAEFSAWQEALSEYMELRREPWRMLP